MKRFGLLSMALLVAFGASSRAEAQQPRGHRHVRVIRHPHPFYGAYYGPHYGPYFHHPYDYAPYAYYHRDPYEVSGVRLKVHPNEAKVFVDGYYAGKVDDFDNAFQQLDLKPGRHEIAVKMAGYRTYRVRVYAAPGRTLKIQHELEKGEGEAAPADPERR